LDGLTGKLLVTPASIIVKSQVQVDFIMKFNASLSATAGPVKLFTCSATDDPLQYLSVMQTAAASANSYSASLAMQGPQLGSLSSSPGVLHFTAVVGTGNNATGAVAETELLPGARDTHCNAPSSLQQFELATRHVHQTTSDDDQVMFSSTVTC
jgi:hypothetical protein